MAECVEEVSSRAARGSGVRRKVPKMGLRDRRGQIAAHADRNRDIDKAELAGCTGKKKMNREESIARAARLQAKLGIKVEGYHCRYADHWHIGKVKRKLLSGVRVHVKVEK